MTTPNTITNPVDPLVGKTLGQSESLSNWVGPYVTNMLGQTQALSQQPYQVYQGPLTAGVSPLQQQAFQGIGSLQAPGSIGQAATTAGNVATQAGQAAYSPTGITTGTWGTQAAQQYMNPYLQSALNPQLQELTRQSDIARLADAARLTGAGAYGGSRQAIMDAENRRNLQNKQSDVLSQGYKTAYDVGQQAFMTDQQRALAAQQAAEQSKQFGASYGLDALSKQLQAAQTQGTLGQAELKAQQDVLNQLATAGAAQRAIEGEGITADYNEFLQQRDYPMKMLQFQQSMLQGMPVQSVSSNYQQPSTLSSILGGTSGILSLLQTAGILPKQ